jgi:hypothetical protein
MKPEFFLGACKAFRLKRFHIELNVERSRTLLVVMSRRFIRSPEVMEGNEIGATFPYPELTDAGFSPALKVGIGVFFSVVMSDRHIAMLRSMSHDDFIFLELFFALIRPFLSDMHCMRKSYDRSHWAHRVNFLVHEFVEGGVDFDARNFSQIAQTKFNVLRVA